MILSRFKRKAHKVIAKFAKILERMKIKKPFVYTNGSCFLAPIAVEILLLFSLKSKRLKRIAGLAPENYYFRFE
jgi:hypothetical protein